VEIFEKIEKKIKAYQKVKNVNVTKTDLVSLQQRPEAIHAPKNSPKIIPNPKLAEKRRKKEKSIKIQKNQAIIEKKKTPQMSTT